MLFPFIDIHALAVFTTLCLWGWARWRSRFLRLSQEREQIKRQNRLAHATFFLFVLLEIGTFALPEEVGGFVVPPLCALVFLRFAVLNGRLRESFWSKKRNLFALTIGLVLLSSIAPFVTSDSIIVPWLYSLWVTQVCLANIARIFRDNIRDLEALQSKLLKLEADMHTNRVRRDANGANLEGTGPSEPKFTESRQTVGA